MTFGYCASFSRAQGPVDGQVRCREQRQFGHSCSLGLLDSSKRILPPPQLAAAFEVDAIESILVEMVSRQNKAPNRKMNKQTDLSVGKRINQN